MRAVLLLLALLPALGVAAPLVTQGGGNGARVTPAPLNTSGPSDFQRLIQGRAAVLGDVEVVDSVPGAKAGTTPIPGVKSTRNIPWPKVAGAAGRIVAPIGTAIAIKDLLDIIRCHYSAGVKCDEGQEEEETPSQCYVHVNQPAYPSYNGCYSAADAIVADKNYSRASAPSGSAVKQEYNYRVSSCSPSGSVGVMNCLWGYSIDQPEPFADSHIDGLSASATRKADGVQRECPAFTDPLDPRLNIPAGEPPMANGKCRTGRYITRPPEEVAAELAQHGDKTKAPDIVRETMERGVDLTPDAGPQTLSGPSSVPGGTTTSTETSPQGTPQTTTTTTSHTVNYNTTVNNYTWHTTTIINKPDGTTTTTEEKPEEPPLSECEVNPEAINCQELDNPEGPDIPEETREVTWAPMAGWGADNASCPASTVVSVQGHSVEVSQSLVCQFATGIRFAVIGIAGVIGALILVGGARQE
jgi:hypothetical protein